MPRHGHHQIPADQGERGGVARLHVCRLAEAPPPVDHSQLGAEFARVAVARIYLVIGSLLVVEITQDRGGAPLAIRRRAFCDVAAPASVICCCTGP
jgi:hypothetical protein